MKDQSGSIPLLMEEWSGLKSQLEILFKNRDVKSSLPLMEKGIALFIQFMFWSNGQQASLKITQSNNSLAFKPINVEERLAFIQTRPSLYQSFRQLCELMAEQEKIYAKINLKRKASSPNKD